MKLIKIADGIDGLFIENHRFSTTLLSVNLYVSLESDTLAVNALLPYILSSCCEKYPDFSALNLKLCELYGAEIGAVSDKIGDCQLIKLFSFSINNELTPDGENIVEQSADLLYDMLFAPSLCGDGFNEKDVERERRLTLEKIEGLINDKRLYAINRCLKEMYRDDPFGELKTGSASDISAITSKRLYSAWKDVILTAKIRIQVIGDKIPDGLFEKYSKKLSEVNRNVKPIIKTVPKKPRSEVLRVTEKMDVTQGKLVMGFCTERTGTDSLTADISVFSDIFGGGPYSKLFSNVREKMSLCYYCAARANRVKGYLIVDSGVEPQNTVKTESAVLAQLEDIQKGNFDEKVLEASKRSIKDSLSCFNDSQTGLDGWYSLKLSDNPLSPEEFSEIIAKVTKDDIIKAANDYTLDTVYTIEPINKGDADNEK